MKTRYWLVCPCGQRMAVDTAQAGQTILCPCGTELTVPTLRDLARLEPVAQAKRSSVRRGRRFWGKRQSRILLGSFILTGAVLGLLLLETLKPRLIDVTKMPPVQVWTLWQDLRRGPDRNLAPAEKAIIDSQGMFHAGEALFAVVGAAGMLLMIFGYAMPGPRTASTGSSERPTEIT